MESGLVRAALSSPRDRGDQGDQGHEGQSPRSPKQEEGDPEAEVFCGRIPKEMTEPELRTLFTAFGPVIDLRMPKFPITAVNKGFAFINFLNKDDAAKAISKLNGRQVRHRQYLKVAKSVPNTRLFIGNIPKAKSKVELFREFSTRANGLREVIIYSSPDDNKKNRGFCFLDYESHKAAASAKRRLSSRDSKVFGCDIMVDWADPEQEVDDATMSKVQILYTRHIAAAVTEDELRALFEPFGPLDRVKKIKDFAFIHFAAREDANKAKETLNGHQLRGVAIEIQWAKPPTTKEMRQQTLRAREKRIMVQHYLKPPRGIVNPFPLPPISWNEDVYSRRDRGDHQGNQVPSWVKLESVTPPCETTKHYLTPEEKLNRFREAAEPYDHWALMQHQLPRIPSHVFLLSDEDEPMPLQLGGFNRGRNKYGLRYPHDREADQTHNWRSAATSNSGPQPPPQRPREWVNHQFKPRRHSEANDTDNWRQRP